MAQLTAAQRNRLQQIFNNSAFKSTERISSAEFLGGFTDGKTAKAAATLAVPITHRVCTIATGGAEALTLANGLPGQRLCLIFITDGGDGTLTPTTKTGFTNITFADVGDQVDLMYVDDTVGWVITGYSGFAAPPVVA